VLATLEKTLKDLSPDLANALTPNVRASFFWPKHPHTKASYAGAKVGQYTHCFEYAARTELGGKLFFAGEHTSAESVGFMNGAVDAGERVAKEMLAAT
jgi:monoamine oxidase